jgi:hypothetical protein
MQKKQKKNKTKQNSVSFSPDLGNLFFLSVSFNEGEGDANQAYVECKVREVDNYSVGQDLKLILFAVIDMQRSGKNVRYAING